MGDFLETFDNPYDPNKQDLEPQTLPIDEVFKRAINTALLRMHTWLPAKVVALRGPQKVDIQPLLQTRYVTNQVVTLPPIQNVMVVMTMGADYSIKVPVAVGDTGIALFCERSLDVWSVSGGVVDPADTRHHDMTDAVFIPGLYPFAAQLTDQTTDLVITNGDAQFRVQKDGKFAVKNKSQELIANLVRLVTALSTASTVVGGPFIPSVVTELNTIIANLQSLEGS